MNRTMITHLRTLLAHPDRPDHDALFAAIADIDASEILACLASQGSLLQIAAALRSEWSWVCDGWEQHTNALVAMITDPRCSVTEQMITTWSCIPNAVGVLRNRTDTLLPWAQQRLTRWIYAELVMLLGPSDAAVRLLMQSPSPYAIGTTLRLWSMAIYPDNPTAWQAMIEIPDLRAALYQKATPSTAFPAWGLDNDVDPETVLRQIVADLINEWSPDHPSIRGRIGWLEHHVTPDLRVEDLALVASIGRSDALAEAVCARLGHNPSFIPRIAEDVPWSRLHPRVQTVIDTTMRRSSDDRWKKTWACALGQVPVLSDTTIDAHLLLWRIAPERWNDRDPSNRTALVSSVVPPNHCYGWGMHPDLVAGKPHPNGRVFRFWNQDAPPDDLRAWEYADRLLKQTSLQETQEMIALLMTLPPDLRTRFDQIIDCRLVGRSKPTDQPTWNWTTWASLPAVDRQRRLRDRLSVLWGDRTTAPVYRGWMARSHLLDTVAVAIRNLLDSKRSPRILAALLAQVPALRVHMSNHRTTLPFPDDLDAARCAQIERLPLARDAQAYAAWCLRVLEQDMVAGSTLIALHPDVAVALVPMLTDKQRADVAASPAAQGWDSITILHWEAICAPAEEPTTLPIQRRIR